MAEIAIGGPAATDIFALAGNYHAQTSSDDDTQSVSHAKGATGDVIASKAHGGMNNVSCPYKYNSTNALYATTDAGNQTLPRPGQLKNGYMVTAVGVAYSLTDWPTVTVTGHKHDSNTHDTNGNIFSPSIDVLSGPASGFGCPALLTNTDTDGSSAPQSENYGLEAEHIDAADGQDDHIAGATIGGMERLSMEFVGTPTLTDTGWYLTSKVGGDGNADFDTTSYAYEKPVSRDT